MTCLVVCNILKNTLTFTYISYTYCTVCNCTCQWLNSIVFPTWAW